MKNIGKILSFVFTAAAFYLAFDRGLFAGAAGPPAFLVSSGVYLGGGTLTLGVRTGNNELRGFGLIVTTICLTLAGRASMPFGPPSLAIIAGGLAGFLASLGAPSLGEKMTTKDWLFLGMIMVLIFVVPPFT